MSPPECPPLTDEDFARLLMSVGAGSTTAEATLVPDPYGGYLSPFGGVLPSSPPIPGAIPISNPPFDPTIGATPMGIMATYNEPVMWTPQIAIPPAEEIRPLLFSIQSVLSVISTKLEDVSNKQAVIENMVIDVEEKLSRMRDGLNSFSDESFSLLQDIHSGMRDTCSCSAGLDEDDGEGEGHVSGEDQQSSEYSAEEVTEEDDFDSTSSRDM